MCVREIERGRRERERGKVCVYMCGVCECTYVCVREMGKEGGRESACVCVSVCRYLGICKCVVCVCKENELVPLN